MQIQLTQILFQIINFSVVVGALTYLLYKPVLKILDERAQRVEDAQRKAEQAEQESQQMAEMKKDAKRDADKQAAQILEEAKQAAEEKKKKIIADARKQAGAEVEELMNNWQTEKAKQMKDMKKEFSDAVLAVTEKVIGKAVDKKAQSKLIDQELDALLKTL